ncbi:MAG: thiol reductant ABC exporter subunit CydD [Microthrixaceae bacterium]
MRRRLTRRSAPREDPRRQSQGKVRAVVDGERGRRRQPRGLRPVPIDPALLRLAPALRRHLLVCVALAIATTAVVLSQTEAISQALPKLVDGDLAAAGPLSVVLLVVGATRFAIGWITEVSASSAAAATRQAITRSVIRHTLALDEAGTAAATPARVTTLVTDGVDALDPWIRQYLPAVCLAIILPLAAGLRILLADPASALILLLTVPLIPLFMVLIGKLTEDRTLRQWATLQRLSGHFHDVLVGLPTLRLFGRASVQVDRVRDVAEQYRVAVMRTLRVAFLSAGAMELLASLSVALVAVTIGFRLTIGTVTLSTALTVLLLAPECSAPIRRVGAAFHAAQAGTDAGAELQEVTSASTTPDGPVDEVRSASSAPPLRIDAATVVDSSRGHRVGPVHAEVAPGTLVALVGASGAGKTTLLDAIRGRVPLYSGSVVLGGVEVTQLSRTARSRMIAWIPQLPDPVGANARSVVGDEAPASIVDEALAAVDLTELVERAPAELSGGERQRLAVARALVRCRPGTEVRLLLADEPTSHLDARRAQLVTSALRRVAAEGPAVVVATHDPRLIEEADEVVLLDGLARAADDERPSTHIGSRVMVDSGATSRSILGAPARTTTPRGADVSVGALPGRQLAWLRRVAHPSRWRLRGARVIGVATELCAVGLAATAAWLIFRSAEGPSFADLALAAVAVRAFALGKALLRYCERLASHDATLRVLADIRGAVVASVGRVAPAGISGWGRGDVMSRVVDDVDRLADQELRVNAPMVSGLTVGVVAVGGAMLVAPGFGFVYAVAVAVIGLALPVMAGALTTSTARRNAQARAELSAHVLELAEHADELSSSGTEKVWTTRIQRSLDEMGRHERRRGSRIGALEGVAAMAAPLLAAGVVAVDRQLGSGVSGPVLGVLVIVPFALLEVLTPLLHAGPQEAVVLKAAARVREVLDAPEPVDDPPEPVAVPATPAVVLGDVALRWPRGDLDVVHGVDLRAEPGALVHIDGPSGSGKSTLAAALVRFVDIHRGCYMLDDVDTRRATGDDVRRVVTWSQQEPWFAATSLRENLHIAAPNATDSELWAALDAVHLTGWAASLPEGMSTLVGRDGNAMSGGQRQRLALARILLAGHQVVVLDEPTAHLDTETAERVLTDLLGSLDERTVVVLGHGGAFAKGSSLQTLTIAGDAVRRS